MERVLSVIANVVVILGAMYGLFEWWRFKCRRKLEKKKLVQYLKERKKNATTEGKKGQHSLTHLVAELKIHADRIIELDFDNDRIQVLVKEDINGFAGILLFTYHD